MPGMGDRRNKLYVLDKELCCALYMRLGAYEKVSARLETEGVIHPVLGVPFSRSGISAAIKKSNMYHDYYVKRAQNPDMSLDPTKEELDNALAVIKERMPAQKSMVTEAEKIQAYRLEHQSVYMDKTDAATAK
jgi:hypothetical protein